MNAMISTLKTVIKKNEWDTIGDEKKEDWDRIDEAIQAKYEMI